MNERMNEYDPLVGSSVPVLQVRRLRLRELSDLLQVSQVVQADLGSHASQAFTQSHPWE